jgi:hypothetical protein
MKPIFKRNLGMIDRVLRGGIGLAAMYFGFYSRYLITDDVAALVFGSMGVMCLTVAIVGYCPGYALIGFSTLKHETQAAH